MIKPQVLKQGDTIGIISPSSSVAAFVPRRLQRGIDTIKAMGFDVVLGNHATVASNHTAGSIEQRVSDLHQMFSNEKVKAIISTIGGYNSNQLLDELDYDLIRQHPKILMGYSDITALLLGIYQQTGVVTFLGPAILPQFGGFEGLHSYTHLWFQRILCSTNAPIEYSHSGLTIHEMLRWDSEDVRPRKSNSHKGPSVIRPGQAKGRIVAGNVGTMLTLAGTPYWPDLTDTLLFIEDDEMETPATIDRFLTQLRLMGVFEKISALLLGRFHPNVEFTGTEQLKDMLLTVVRGYNFPIGIDFDFGHTDPMFILPIGTQAQIDFGESIHLMLLESGVTE